MYYLNLFTFNIELVNKNGQVLRLVAHSNSLFNKVNWMTNIFETQIDYGLLTSICRFLV